MNKLPENIIVWISENNNIESLRLQLKEMTETHRISTDKLILELKKTENRSLKISDGFIQLETENKASSFSLKKLQEIMEEYFEDEKNRASECMEFIKSRINSSCTESKEVIKRYKL